MTVKPTKLKKTVSLSDSDEDNKENDTVCISPGKANITKASFQAFSFFEIESQFFISDAKYNEFLKTKNRLYQSSLQLIWIAQQRKGLAKRIQCTRYSLDETTDIRS